MKYFAAILLALAVQIKVSVADCESFVTVSQNFTELCAKFPPDQKINLPDPTDENCYIVCLNHVAQRTCDCKNHLCFNVEKGFCGSLEDDKSNCVDSAKICDNNDKRVPYCLKTDPISSKYFADCNTASGMVEVGLCFSSLGKRCKFDHTELKCKEV